MKKLLSIIMLLVAIVTGAWAQTTLVNLNFADETGPYTAGQTATVDGTSVYFKSAASINSNYLLFAGNASTSSNFIAIPLSNINGEITITVTYPSARPQWKYYFKGLDATPTTSDLSSNSGNMSENTRPSSNTTTSTWKIEGITKSYGVFYIGAGGNNNNKKLASITITTPASSEPQAPTKPSITGVPGAAVAKNASVTLTASSTGAPTPTYQWYTCDSKGENQAEIPGAGEASYSPATTSLGTTYYIVKASNSVQSGVASDVVAIQVVGSSECKLLQVQYSNNFYAFIKQPTTEKPDDPYSITSYYLEGEEAPTIVNTGVTVSEGATWAVEGTTLTVTAEDGTTKAEFTINAPVAVAPYTGLGEYTFTASDTWVKTGYAFDTASGKKGWKFAKNVESDGKLRNADGRTRIYLFVGPCKTIKLTSGCSSDRDIRVYRNGTEVLAKTTLANNGTVTFNGDESNACMYEVRSAQTGGDGSIEIMTVATTNENIEIDNSGVATYVTKQALNFTGLETKAYVVTGVNEAKTSVATAEVTTVPAGTALLVKGATVNVPVIANATAPAINLLQKSTGEGVQGADNIFAYSKSAKKFKRVDSSIKVPAGKCYLVIDGVPTVNSLDVDFNGATAINNVNANENANSVAPVKVIKNGKLYIGNYNVAGQLVK